MSTIFFFLIPIVIISFIIVAFLSLKGLNEKLNKDLKQINNDKRQFRESKYNEESISKLIEELEKINQDLQITKLELQSVKKIVEHSTISRLKSLIATKYLKENLYGSCVEHISYTNQNPKEISVKRRMSNTITNY